MLPGGGGVAGVKGGGEAGVQAGMQQCGEGAVLAEASWKQSILD